MQHTVSLQIVFISLPQILVASDSGIEKPAVPGRTDEFLMRIITKHRRAHVKVTVGDADCWLQARGLEYAGQEEQTLGFDLGTKHLTGMRTDWGVLSIFSLLVIQVIVFHCKFHEVEIFRSKSFIRITFTSTSPHI